MYKCKYFKIYELVDPVVYEQRGQKAWELLDSSLLTIIDALRETFGPATVNNWKWGGKFKWSGLRTPQCKIGARYSQHRFGRAADLKFKNISPKEVRAAIKSDSDYWGPLGIFCIENRTATWVHISVQNCTPIKWINP